jgi:TPR repeat protein
MYRHQYEAGHCPVTQDVYVPDSKFLHIPGLSGIFLLLMVLLSLSVDANGGEGADTAKALYQQGLAYARGEDVDQDFEKAAGFFSRATEKGDIDAMYQLGLLHARGDGVKQDFFRARQLLHDAAMGGHPRAMYHLAGMHEHGDGGKVDYVEATVWYWLSASLGDKYAEARLRTISIRISSAQYSQARKRADALWKEIPHDRLRQGSIVKHK